MEADEATFSIVCCFQRKEFVGQKPLNKDEEMVVFGESITEVLESIWVKASPFIKREVIVNGDQFEWCETAVPTKDEFGKFIIFQDRIARKCYTVDQINSTLLSRLRHKHVNVIVHVYGRQLCNKSVHAQFTSRLLQPEQRDRANANNTQSLMALVQVLKQKHGTVFAANVSVWQMWANSIQSAQPHLQDEMINSVPPSHLIHMFVRAATSEAEVRESLQRGMQVAGNLNDKYAGQLAMIRSDFNKLRSDLNHGFDFMDARLSAFEDMVDSSRLFVAAVGSVVKPQPNVVSMEQERLVTDLEDTDHI